MNIGRISKSFKKIIQLDLNGNFIKNFNSLKEAQNVTGIKYGCLSSVLHGKRKTTGGFKWIFDNKDNNLLNLDEKKTPVSQGLSF
jgi:hypothetical protein